MTAKLIGHCLSPSANQPIKAAMKEAVEAAMRESLTP